MIVGCSLSVGTADESDAGTGYLTEDGIKYLFDTDTGTAKVTYFDNSTSEVTIPSTVSDASTSTTYYVTEIGNQAFDGKSITRVTIGDKVTTIGNYAFRYCKFLETVEFLGQVELINIYAFYGCEKLQSITIPDTVTSIGTYAFCDCSELKTVTLEENSKLTSIGADAFEKCYKLEFVNLEKATELESIGGWAFYKCELLNSLCSSTDHTDLELNTKLKTIGNRAFAECYKLESVTIPDSVTTIAIYAFENDTSLETINIKNKIIESNMFSGCTSIKSVTFPDTLTSVGTDAFSGITFYEANGTVISSVNAANLKGSTFERSGSALTEAKLYRVVSSEPIIYELRTSTSPNYVAVTGYNATYFPSDGSVTIKNQVEFDGVPYDVTTIEPSAFLNCTSLKNVVIPDTVTSIGDKAFKGCTALESVSIPDSVTSIGVEAFNGCTDLGSATIGTGLTEIGPSMFYNCGALESVTINGDITKIGAGAFYGCKISSITIPGTVTTIDSQAFQGCTSLSSITIPDSVTTLGTKMFYGCTNLNSVTISNNVTSLPDHFFYDCTSLRNLTLGEKITSLGNYYVFENCSDISVKVLSPTITGSLFYECTSISGLTIGSKVTEIKSRAFMNCTSLVSVTFEDDNELTTIGSQAFLDCTSLESIDLEKTTRLTTIGQYAFAGCSVLGSVAEKPVVIPNTVKTIGNSAFYYCKALKSVTIPSLVETIEQYTFASCDSLEKVEIASGVKNIGCYAFAYSKIKHISIPSSVVDIDSNAFYGAAFYDSDGTTTLQVTAESLRGFTFKGDSPSKLIKQAIVISHSVTYDPNGGTGNVPVQEDVQEGETFVIKAYDGTKSGFTFGGWSYGGQTYQPNETMTMGASDITLTAVWTSITAHSVTYDPNGGIGYTPVQTDVVEGVAFLVQGYTGTKDGFTFGGWSYNGRTYQSGDMITMGGSAIVLTAVWDQIYVPVPDTDDEEPPFFPVIPVQPVGGNDTTKTVAVVIAACAAALLAMMFLVFDRRS